MASSQEIFEVARPKKVVTFGLIVLAIFLPWFALYLDGSSWPTIAMNFAAWIFLPILGPAGAFIHAIICLCRTDKHRMYSKPARRRLRYDNHLSANTQAHIEMKAVEPEPEPAPVIRAIAEPPPAPVESAPTEPIAKNPSATSSSTSVSSSDVEEETAPAPAPLQRTATVPLQRTATAPPARAATAKKEDDPFKDPNA